MNTYNKKLWHFKNCVIYKTELDDEKFFVQYFFET